MYIEKDEVIFTSGRRMSANGGIIGLDLAKLEVYEGYDGHFYNPSFQLEEDDPLTKEELLELADYMVFQWKALYNRILREGK